MVIRINVMHARCAQFCMMLTFLHRVDMSLCGRRVGLCVLAAEIDSHARQAYEAQWGARDQLDRPKDGSSTTGHLMIGDITSVYAAQLSPIDILTAGTYPSGPLRMWARIHSLHLSTSSPRFSFV
eukprot:COSAG02_NODE_160_length_32694_cov_18.496947_4_plen_125_part_00